MSDSFLKKCELEDQISYLERTGQKELAAKKQLELDLLHECQHGESEAKVLRERKDIRINWPLSGDCRYGFVLDQKLADVFKIKLSSWGLENQTFEPFDEQQFTDVLSFKIQELGLDGLGERKIGDLVYAYAWDGSKYRYWCWDEREMDFLIPLKKEPLVWRECNESEALRVLGVQRFYAREEEPGYVFGYLLTSKVGHQLLRDWVESAKYGLQTIFAEKVLQPALCACGWKNEFKKDMMIVRTHGGRDFGCDGWDDQSGDFVPHTGYCDVDMERWLGWMCDLELYPKDEGFYPVWVPESLAYLLMDAARKIDFESAGVDVDQTRKFRFECAEYVEYRQFRVKSFCGIFFGSKLDDNKSLCKVLALKKAFRGFAIAKCDFTAGGNRLYRVTLLRKCFVSEMEVRAELDQIKHILEEKYTVNFVKFPRDIRKSGFDYMKINRLVHRTVDSSGLIRLAARDEGALFAERGKYQFALYAQRCLRDTAFELCISIEDCNIYERDNEEALCASKKALSKVKSSGDIDIL